MSLLPRRRRARLAGLGAAATLAAAAALTLTVVDAQAATLFSDNFESGTGNWSKSGGTWSVVTDGSQVFQQESTTTDRARQFAGSTGWTNYSVQARVKATGFTDASSVVALAARVSSSTKMYRLSLTNSNTVRLEYMNGSSLTTIASLSRTVATGTWYTLRIDVNGATISGYVDGVAVGSGSSSAIPAGRVGLFTGYAAGRFDDVTVTDSATTPPSSTPPTSPSASPTASPTGSPTTSPTGGGGSTGLVGWATQGGGTTGGAGGATVTVTSYDALVAEAKSTATETIRVSGLFTCSEDVRVAANKSILGVGSGSGLVGCGINIRDVSNVVVRNMNISKVPAGNGNGDAIHIDGATRVWIDHNDLSSDTSHGTDYYDGLLDITHGADYITASWNRIHDHIKCSLVGHSDSNSSEDTGHLRVTYHHNLFSNCAERNPRVRFGNPVHVFNNYYVNTQTFDYSYAIATTENAGVLVEGNYFENITDPTHIGEGDSDPGNLVARDNYLVNSGTILTSGSVASIPYAYTLDPASSVKSIVTSGAGTGKITT
ncbi:MAG TPA: LamG-like jellyroll fold domain-containing protein [Rugosimonospora sp.]|nr:LamG-like jellyroll fold domain-containing protein [Rugosimonospora sp.]